MPKLTFAKRNQLFDLLAENFNLNELKTLCFRVGVEKLVDSSDQDNLITSLLITLETEDRIADLITVGKKQQPTLNWPPIGLATPAATIVSPQTNLVHANTRITSSSSSSNIFISYSQKDDLWKERFRIHLGFLERQGLVKLWSDQESLEVGEDWYSAIEQAISQAKIVLLLVSPHFLNSKFVAEHEIPRFLERRQQGELLMYAVICEPCAWKAVDWLSRMQIRPRRGKPLSSDFTKKEVEKVLAELAEEIHDKLMAMIAA